MEKYNLFANEYENENTSRMRKHKDFNVTNSKKLIFLNAPIAPLFRCDFQLSD